MSERIKRNFIPGSKIHGIDDDRVETMINLKIIGCDQRICLEVARNFSTQLLLIFTELIELKMGSIMAHQCCVHVDSDRFSDLIQLKKDGMSDTYAYTAVMEKNKDTIDGIRRLFNSGFSDRISVTAGSELKDDTITNMIRLRKANFCENICYEAAKIF